MNVRAPLTQSSLLVALDAVVSSQGDAACRDALQDVAAKLQTAVLLGQPASEVDQVLTRVPQELQGVLKLALDRAVSVAAQDDGSTLVTWLLPVVVSTADPLPSVIHLERQSLNGMKTAAYLQQQLGVGSGLGWVYPLPALFHVSLLKTADLDTLVRLPGNVRAVVAGEAKSLSFDLASNQVVDSGVCTYYLPFVARHPAGQDIDLPAACERVSHRVTKWVSDSLAATEGLDVEIHVGPQPHIFADAFDSGARQQLDVLVRESITSVCDDADMAPNGMAALVAPYVTHRMEENDYVLGISLVSRLTGAVITTLAIPALDDDDMSHTVGMVGRILEELGMQVIQLRHEAIPTYCCQHCGQLQYSMPSLRGAEHRNASVCAH